MVIALLANFINTNVYVCIFLSRGGRVWHRPNAINSAVNRHFSVAPYITICPSTETYFGLYLRGAMSEVTGIYLFRLLLNIILFALRSLFTLANSA